MGKLHTEVNLEGARALTLLIGISPRNLRGFIFFWTQLPFFILRTKKAEGCLGVLAGIGGPFAATLISYWDSEESLKAFVRSRPHAKWMQFIYRNPQSLDLFNETYAAPLRANFINRARGYAASIETSSERKAG